MVEILFTTHNRLEFTHESFAALLANTDWERVTRLHIADDRSKDGTYEFLSAAVREVPTSVRLVQSDFRGSVNALAHTLELVESDVIAKIDNDVIVCPDWLEMMCDVLAEYEWVDALGMEPGFAERYVPGRRSHQARPARWIGGVGLFRNRIFTRNRPRQNDRFFGMTAFWRKYAKTAWIDPDLPVFLLDHLPFDPWRKLTERYVAQGWSRAWPEEVYPEEWRDYWAWWQRDRAALA